LTNSTFDNLSFRFLIVAHAREERSLHAFIFIVKLVLNYENAYYLWMEL